MLSSTNFWIGIALGAVAHMAWQKYRVRKATS